ncbi:MAG: helix-turn-helix domain-containing protein [Gaiellaceae bacterium]
MAAAAPVQLCAAGSIPHYKQEGRLLFRREELDEWLAGFAQGQREGRC